MATLGVLHIGINHGKAEQLIGIFLADKEGEAVGLGKITIEIFVCESAVFANLVAVGCALFEKGILKQVEQGAFLVGSDFV